MLIKKTSQARNLEIGTVVTLNDGWGEIISEYDEFHNGFDVAEMQVDDDGNLFKTGKEFSMTLHDLVGHEF